MCGLETGCQLEVNRRRFSEMAVASDASVAILVRTCPAARLQVKGSCRYSSSGGNSFVGRVQGTPVPQW